MTNESDSMTSLKKIAKQIFEARKKRSIKQEVLGQLVGCSGSYITKIERGMTVPSAVMAIKLEKSLKLKKDSILNSVLALRMRETSFKREAILKARRGARAEDLSGYVLIPLLIPVSMCAAGIEEEIEKYVPIPKDEINGDKMYLIRMPDDCLENEGMHEGDLLLVEMSDPKHGQFCVYCVGADYFVRRYAKCGSEVKLEANSTNSSHKSIVCKKETGVVFKGVVRAVYLRTLPLFHAEASRN